MSRVKAGRLLLAQAIYSPPPATLLHRCNDLVELEMVFHCGSSRQSVSWCADDVWQCKTSRVVTNKSLRAIIMRISVLIFLSFVGNSLPYMAEGA